MPPVRLNPDLPLKLEEIINKPWKRTAISVINTHQTFGQICSGSSATQIRVGQPPAQHESLKSTAKSTLLRLVAATGVAILLVGLVVGVWLLHSRKVCPLTDKDTIVLADFANTTGDTVFDGTLRQGLSILLEQSPFLKDTLLAVLVEKSDPKEEVLAGKSTLKRLELTPESRRRPMPKLATRKSWRTTRRWTGRSWTYS